MGKKLRRKFFTRATLRVAKDLLGKYLVRQIGNPGDSILKTIRQFLDNNKNPADGGVKIRQSVLS